MIQRAHHLKPVPEHRRRFTDVNRCYASLLRQQLGTARRQARRRVAARTADPTPQLSEDAFRKSGTLMGSGLICGLQSYRVRVETVESGSARHSWHTYEVSLEAWDVLIL